MKSQVEVDQQAERLAAAHRSLTGVFGTAAAKERIESAHDALQWALGHTEKTPFARCCAKSPAKVAYITGLKEDRRVHTDRRKGD